MIACTRSSSVRSEECLICNETSPERNTHRTLAFSAGALSVLWGALARGAQSGAEVTLVVPAPFIHRGAFVALIGVTIVVLMGFLSWVRIRQVTGTVRMRRESRLAERGRIARELHDTLLQSTEGLILKVYTAAQRLAPGDPVREFLTRSVDQAEELAIEGRQKLMGLRPHSQSRQELSQALAALGLEFSADTATTFVAVKKGRVRSVAAPTWDEVFSIAREAISNAFRHASADHIEAEVTYGSSSLIIQIRDDGCGVREELNRVLGIPGHIGLRVMHERAAELRAQLLIATGADRGTIVTLTVPAALAYTRRATLSLVAPG